MSLVWLKHRYSSIGDVGSNTVWLTIEQLCAAASGIVLTIIAARFYGPQTLGDLAFAMGFVGLFLPLVTFGLQPIIVREVTKRNYSDSEIIAASLFITLTLSGLSILFMGSLITVVTDRPGVHILAMILGFRVFLSTSNILSSWHQAHLKSRLFAKVRIVGMLFGWILYALCVAFDLSIYLLAWGVTMETLVVIVMAVAVSFGKSTELRIRKPGRSLVQQLLKYAAPIAVSTVAITIYHRSDQVMLGIMSSPTETGLYAAASRVYGAMILIPAALAASAFPRLIKGLSAQMARTPQSRFQWYFDSVVGCGLFFSVACFITAPFAIVLLYGNDFEGSISVLKIHALATIFASIGTAQSRYILAVSMQKFTMIATLIGALVNVVLNLSLIPRYGADGAAIATLVSQVLTGYLICSVHPDLRGMFFVSTKAILLPLRIVGKGIFRGEPAESSQEKQDQDPQNQEQNASKAHSSISSPPEGGNQ